MEFKLDKLVGWLLFISLLISLVSSFVPSIPSFTAGIPIWICAFILLPRIKPNQQKQIAILLLAGSAGILFSLIYSGHWPDLTRALEANQKVVTMLIAVGFLKVCTTNLTNKTKDLPIGRRALFRTLVGAHLFGAVLNMSSVIIVGDKLAAQKKISDLQALLLLRAFCICAFWSPFFAAMGLTLISAPGAQLNTLVIYGLPLSVVAILVSAWEILRTPDSKQLEGYPMALDSLWMPCFLALIVIGIHEIEPRISVLTLVSLTSIVFTFGLLIFKLGIRSGVSSFKTHIEKGVVNSSNEVVLFASAALLAAGFAATMTALDLHIAPPHYGPLEASITLVILVILALTGMHPVTSVVLAGGILAPSVSDPNLLGLTLLMGWSLGIAISPFSGVQLSIQSRYDINAKSLLRLNWRYALIMFVFCFAILWLYSLNTHLPYL
ncbi:hypothetical protein OAP63_01715 [Vibrio sp.]|uniref:Uncharacterized protein n=1 Tax=Vibrio viridaestus TaxID=2487322 RepID=A0A3N9TMA6_9VIBR|nr:hypothetical protein [Vibrio viridaestus]MDC0609427.1 hypothetical protein [Vibrio sp.]RQW64765.1 hypothetical protein EES38_01575 [Vibrio viridaestus]